MEKRYIAYTFKHGRVGNPKILRAVAICGVALLVAGIAFAASSSCSAQPEALSTAGITIGTVATFILIIAFFLAFRREQIYKEITLWRADEQLTERQVTPVNVTLKPYKGNPPIKLAVKFRYDGQKITVISQKFSYWFYRLADKEVTILYSPIYNQVMILS